MVPLWSAARPSLLAGKPPFTFIQKTLKTPPLRAPSAYTVRLQFCSLFNCADKVDGGTFFALRCPKWSHPQAEDLTIWEGGCVCDCTLHKAVPGLFMTWDRLLCGGGSWSWDTRRYRPHAHRRSYRWRPLRNFMSVRPGSTLSWVIHQIWELKETVSSLTEAGTS